MAGMRAAGTASAMALMSTRPMSFMRTDIRRLVTAPLLDDDQDPVVSISDVDDRTGVRDVPEHVIQVDAELRELLAHEAARRDLRRAHPGDPEGDRDVHLRLAAGRDRDARRPPAEAGRHRRIRRERGPAGAVPAEHRLGVVLLLVDVADRLEQTVGLLSIDLPVREQLQDLLPLFARHQRPRRASSSAAAASTSTSPPATRARRSLTSTVAAGSPGGP